MNRYDYERAVESSRLDAPCRALAGALARRLNRDSGAIPAHAQPSLCKLARLTGYGVSTVKRHLHHLAAGGWVERHPPPRWLAQTEHAVTSYTLTMPAEFPQARPKLSRALGPEQARARPATGRAHGPQGGAGMAQGGPQGPERPQGETESRQPDAGLVRVAQDELSALTRRQVSDADAAEAARQILAGRVVARPAAYLRRALRADPERWVTRRRADERSVAEAIAAATDG